MTLSPGLSLPYTISGVWWLSPRVTSMGSGAVGLGEMSFGDAGSVYGNQRRCWLSCWRVREAAGTEGWWEERTHLRASQSWDQTLTTEVQLEGPEGL